MASLINPQVMQWRWLSAIFIRLMKSIESDKEKPKPGSGLRFLRYPSSHTVTYNYDSAERLADKIPGSQTPSELAFSGNLGEGGVTTRTYAKGITYDAGGRMTREQFGTDTLLYHNSHYNVRGQLYDTRVGSGTDGNGSEFTWNRGCLQMYYESSYTWGASGPSNNGNLLRSLQYLPNNDQITSFAMNNEDYTYDSLNRLTSASEAGPIYRQSYTYDRWGNRTIDYNNSTSNIPRQQFAVAASTNRLGVPSGQSGTMTYDNAGNLINDTYSGQGQRIYNAENRMTAAQDIYSGWSYYTYDAGGSRVRRKINNQETWQIYGIGGELVAEYAANASPTSPQKEYGYRSGQLLVTATSTTNDIQWLVTDQLGTPRMIFDKTGSLAGTKRHDYLPFGEELYAGIGSRSAALGYGVANDGVRQKFTLKERDNETGLDYFEARYYGSTEGRFTSPDPLLSSGSAGVPQSWNRYTYCVNNPLAIIDPSGLIWGRVNGEGNPNWYKDEEEMKKARATAFTPENNVYQATNGQWVRLNANGPGSSPDVNNWTIYNAFQNPYYVSGWEYTSDPNTPRGPIRDGGVETDWTAQFAIASATEMAGKLTIDFFGSLISSGTRTAVTDTVTEGATTSLVQQNKVLGDAFRDEVGDLMRSAGREVETEVTKRTPFGVRKIDIEVSSQGKRLGGIETKVGSSRYLPAQRAKDAWLRFFQNYPVNVVRKP
jgi:RHS repeat-associated protein